MQRLQRADQVLGLLACALLQPLRWWPGARSRATEPRSVLLIKFWGIGSLQLLTPAVASLRARHPRARLTLLTLADNADLARGLGVFDEVWTLDVVARTGPPGWAVLAGRLAALVLRLRRARFDAVYDFEFFTRFSALVSLLSGAPRTHGFLSPRVWRGAFHERTVPFNRYWHVARNFRALAGGEDGRDVAPGDVAPFRVSTVDRHALRARLAEAGLDPARGYAVLNPNAGRLSLERRWPAERFGDLARALIDREGLAVVLVGLAGEREHVALVARHVGVAAPGDLVDLCGRLTVGELAALLERADVVVSNDSGPMHVAAALGAPTLGLFGPETPIMYAPLGERADHLWRPPPCSPCINVHDNKLATCVRGRAECLMALEVEEVLAAARGLMQGATPAHARPLRLLPGGRRPAAASLALGESGEAN